MADFQGQIPLAEADPELFAMLEGEKVRQATGISLIASENFTSLACLEASASMLTNKYAEGYPGKRYYGGNEYTDQVETLCINRALETYRLDKDAWGVNVQPYSGSVANFSAYSAVIKPHDRLMGLDLPSGGHLTHGYYTAKRKISSTSIFFESFPYKVDQKTGIIDYDMLEIQATQYVPNLLICGGSAYPRDWDFARFRKIADKVGAILLCDMAHVSGLVAAQECNNPFEYCDIVTTTTHKTLRGPRGGMIFFKKGPIPDKEGNPSDKNYDYEARINFSVFPGSQGGPHMNTIASIATCLKEAGSPEFKTYIQDVKSNMKALGEELMRQGYDITTGGTDLHLLVWDLRKQGITGSKVEEVCNAARLYVNKNTVPGDVSALSPGGVRLGSSCMTSRGLKEADFVAIANLLIRSATIAVAIQKEHGKKLVDFRKGLAGNADIEALSQDVTKLASTFPLPGNYFPNKE